MCEVAFEFEHALKIKDPLTKEQRSYELPDNKGIIQVDHHTRFKATELLFDPDSAGLMGNGVVDLAYRSIEKCDPDLQITLYNNIVLTGGTTMLPGYKERFEKDLSNKAGTSLRTDINVTADLHRKFAAWIGGSMIASLNTFEGMCIKEEEYNEGSNSIEKGSKVLEKTIF